MAFERVLDDPALDALAAPVNQPDLSQARLVRGSNVLLDNRRDVSRRERMEIELRVDWNSPQSELFTYAAVTDVAMPPRGVKAPTTVILRGAQAATRSSRI